MPKARLQKWSLMIGTLLLLAPGHDHRTQGSASADTNFAKAADLAAGAQNARTGRLPNVIVILTDDLGYGDLSCYGSQVASTPNLDKMAARGAKFTNFYMPAAVCSPSRAGLLTGRYPIRTGITQILTPMSQKGLPPEEVTIAEVLHPLGYKTACIGKWHLGNQAPYLPREQGFDSYFGILNSADQEPRLLYRDDTLLETDPDPTLITQRYTDEAISFIRASKDQPFFLYLAYAMPHAPQSASPEWRGKSGHGIYADVVEELDASVGKIFATVKELGIKKNTLLIFTSDNGPVKNGGGSAGVLRGGKFQLYEGGIRVPLIARWPHHISRGQVVDEPAISLDLLPTFAMLAGGSASTDATIDGHDLSDVLLGTGHRAGQDFFFYAGTRLGAMRSGKWKVIFNGSGTQPSELYDLDSDPSEATNVIAANQDTAQMLSDKAASFDRQVKGH